MAKTKITKSKPLSLKNDIYRFTMVMGSIFNQRISLNYCVNSDLTLEETDYLITRIAVQRSRTKPTDNDIDYDSGYLNLLNDNDIVLKTYKNYLQSLQNIEKFKISIENELFEKIEGVIYESNIDKNSPKATKMESYMDLLSNATKAIS